MTTTYTTGQVGERLGVSADTVRRWWPDWHAQRGFPRPLPLATNGRALLRWDAAAVETWRARPTVNVDELDNVDWSAIARTRLAALLAGRDPDLSA